MGIFLLILFGALVGWLSSFFVNADGGFLFYMVLGIVGSLLGGLIMNAVGGKGITGFNFYSIFVGVLGSIVLVVLVRLIA